jgi:CubicO group peptidase (beta-lactamase class C family)
MKALTLLAAVSLAVIPAALGATKAKAYDVSRDGDWHVADDADVDQAAVQRLYDYAFTRVGPDKDKKGVRTDGLVVVRGGEIVLEKYYGEGGWTQDTPHITWSVSKSFLQALVAITIQAGKLSLDDQVSKYLPDIAHAADAQGRALKIRDLLEMSSCIQWEESYEGVDLTQSSVLAMLYGVGHKDMTEFMAKKPLACAPGSQWEYSSGNSVELMRVLRVIYGDDYALMPWKQLFEPLGITSAVWETDTAGNFVASSYLYATPRDLARLGYLYLKDGIWRGQRILPEGWVNYTAQPAAALLRDGVPVDPKEGIGGPHWWSNAPIPSKGIKSSEPAIPADAFAAEGHWGQAIYVVPSLDLVVVRVGDDRDGTFSTNNLVKLVLDALKIPAVADQGPQGAGQPVPADKLHETPYWTIPSLSSAFVSKEMCSCLFVEKRNEEQCQVYASQEPMFAAYAIDAPHKTVRAALRFVSIGGHGPYENTAKFKDLQHGCGLVP